MSYNFWYSLYKWLLFILQFFFHKFWLVSPFPELKVYVPSIGESLCFRLGKLMCVLDASEGDARLNTKRRGMCASLDTVTSLTTHSMCLSMSCPIYRGRDICVIPFIVTKNYFA